MRASVRSMCDRTQILRKRMKRVLSRNKRAALTAAYVFFKTDASAQSSDPAPVPLK